MKKKIAVAACLMLAATGFGQGTLVSNSKSSVKKSKASFYSGYKHTANGERFDPNSMTVAHKTLPFGSMVRVENVSNGKSVTVRVNNRGPFIKGRDLDLTPAAFKRIASPVRGVVPVEYVVLLRGNGKRR